MTQTNMFKHPFGFVTILLMLLLNSFSPLNAQDLVLVTGRTRDYLTGEPITGAAITVLEKPDIKLLTDENGRFSFEEKVGNQVTLYLEKTLYHPTQTATIIVPPGGNVGPLEEITLQVPSILVFYLFELILPSSPDPDKCHLVVTVTGYNKTLNSHPQGEPNATVTIDPPIAHEGAFYFGYWRGITDPFIRDLNETSLDGGVLYFNAEPSNQLYTISAHKPGVHFSNSTMQCRKGIFVNGSPPWGPRVIK